MLLFTRNPRKKSGQTVRDVQIDQEKCDRIHTFVEEFVGPSFSRTMDGLVTDEDTVLQPPSVRVGTEAETKIAAIDRACSFQGMTVHRVMQPDLGDPRMQNIAVPACIHQLQLVPGMRKEDFLRAMGDLPAGVMLAAKAPLFQAIG